MCHLDWTLDIDSWLTGLMTDFAGVNAPVSVADRYTSSKAALAKGSISGFVRSHRAMCLSVPTDPAQAGRGWPSPRSWHNASQILPHLPDMSDATAMLVTSGCVGEAAAIEYFAWVVASDLHDPEAVLDDPSIVDWSSRPDRIFALLSSVVAIATTTPKRWQDAIAVMTACASAGHPDLAWSGTSTLLNNAPADATIPPETATAFSDIMVHLERWSA